MNRYCATGLAGLLMVAAAVGPVRGDEPAEGKQAEQESQGIQIFDAVKLTIPEGWKARPVRSRIIEHEFVVPADDSEDGATARVTMMAAGGDIGANIDRWKGQFSGPAKAEIDKMEVSGLTVHLVQLSGSFKETMGGGPFAGGKTVVRENYGMLGAIIVMQDGRQYFIKMTGPKKVVDAQREDFKAMLKGLQV